MGDLVYLLMSALVAALTVGGKAIGKSLALNSCTQILTLVGRVIYFLSHIPQLFQKKNHDS